MIYKKFGNSDEKLSQMGLGCFSMSGAYGIGNDEESLATIQLALDLGITLLDTSASYGEGHNHRLIGKALKNGRREKVFIHSKSGTIKTDQGSKAEGSGTPARLRELCETSLQNLGTDYLDAFCMSRIDPSVPVEESVGGMGRLVEEGKTRFIGLSEASPESLKRGYTEHPLVSLQYEYSLWTRDVENGHLAACEELGMAMMAYAPLGYGFLTGTITDESGLEQEDTRQKFPRLKPDNMKKNLEKVAVIQEIAGTYDATPAQIAIAWTFLGGEHVFPIPGCKTRTHLEENVAAIDIVLNKEDIDKLNEVFAPESVSGERYPPDGMARVNL